MQSEIEKVQQLAEPLAHSMGLELLKAELTSEGSRRILRLYLDKAEGQVTVEDCARMSDALGPILDVEGNLAGSYHLEVSSPGLNRPLVRPPHFQAQVGKIIQVQTEEEVEGRRHFKGALKEWVGGNDADGAIRIEVDDKIYTIPFRAIRKATLDFFATEKLNPNE